MPKRLDYLDLTSSHTRIAEAYLAVANNLYDTVTLPLLIDFLGCRNTWLKEHVHSKSGTNKSKSKPTCKQFLSCAKIWARVKLLPRRTEPYQSRIWNFVECETSNLLHSNIPSRKIGETEKEKNGMVHWLANLLGDSQQSSVQNLKAVRNTCI